MDSAEPIDGVQVGEVIGGYRLERQLGAGSVSRVYLGQHLRLGRKVAIKVLSETNAGDARVIDRFLNEARIVNDIRHPNIVDISDFIETESPRRLALVMEHIEGPSLKALIRRGDRLSVAQAAGVVLQLVSACEAAHGAGVIHRDIKPDNLLLTIDPAGDTDVIPGLKVVDFGIAKIGSLGEKTATGMMIGTPAYMAPEQIAGKPPPSSATDVFAIGEVLYEVLTGQRAYPPGQISQMIQTKLKGELPKLETPLVPGGVALLRLIERCLSLRMQERPRLDEIRATLLEVCPEAEVILPRSSSKKKVLISEADTVEPPDEYATKRADQVRAPVVTSSPKVHAHADAYNVVTVPQPNVGMPPLDAKSALLAPTAMPEPSEPVPVIGALASPSPPVIAPTAVAPLPARGIALTPSHSAIPAVSTSPTLHGGEMEAKPTAVAAVIPTDRVLNGHEPPEKTVTPVIVRDHTPPEPAAADTRIGSPFDDSTTVVKRMTEHARAMAKTASRSPPAFFAGLAAVACVVVAVVLGLNVESASSSAKSSGPEADPEVVAVPLPRARSDAPRARVEVASDPPGARVEDAETKRAVGTTPFTLELGPGSPARVRISLEGYEPRELDLPRGNAHVNVALEKRSVRTARPAKQNEEKPKTPENGAKPNEGFPQW